MYEFGFVTWWARDAVKKARETNDLSLESYLDALYTFTHA